MVGNEATKLLDTIINKKVSVIFCDVVLYGVLDSCSRESKFTKVYEVDNANFLIYLDRNYEIEITECDYTNCGYKISITRRNVM